MEDEEEMYTGEKKPISGPECSIPNLPKVMGCPETMPNIPTQPSSEETDGVAGNEES